jgi:hypothetical protein
MHVLPFFANTNTMPWLLHVLPIMLCASGTAGMQHQGSSTIPLICIQLLLPESRQRLTSWLQEYAALQDEQLEDTDAGCNDADTHSSAGLATATARAAASAATSATTAAESSCSLQSGGSQQQPHDTFIQPHGSKQQQQQQPDESYRPASTTENTCSNASRFWQGFTQSLAVVCAAEISYGLMGAACLAPGAIALVSNLVRSVDASALAAQSDELIRLPGWAREYLAGARNELYEVPLLPRHMWGHSVATITR